MPSIINADILNSKIKDIIINAAPKAFNNEYISELLLILFNCSNKYIMIMKATPMVPKKS